MKKFLPLLLLPAAWWGWTLYRQGAAPPEAAFARATRETLVSVLSTNGKVEPIEWRPVRAETAGLVDGVYVQQGRRVRKGDRLVELKSPGLQAELAEAERRIEAARAELAAMDRGGRGAERAEIENGLARARFARERAQAEYDARGRLQEKQAATPFEVNAARAELRQAEIELEALARRKAALAAGDSRQAAEASLKEGQAARELALERMAQLTVRAPMDGAAYGLEARAGAWLNAGDLVANVGRLDRLRVRVYVDEPELGRVAAGQPVAIAWDASPERSWEGAVERLPSEIAPVGSRQVGEVWCSIANPEGRLLPGANVNVEIRTKVVANALTIPKETLRREPALGLWALEGGQVRWRKVSTGASSVTRVEVTAGLKDGEAVALPSERVWKDGDRVKAVFP